MARIHAGLIPALMKKLGVRQARVYSLIQEISAANRIPRHLGALLLAGDNGISFQKYATREDLVDLQGMRNHKPVDVATSAAPPRAAPRRGKPKAPAKAKDNSVFVVYGRDEELRKSMFAFLRALSLKPLEWGHALDQVKSGNPDIKNVIEVTMAKAQAVVVLFSPDDEVRLKEELRSREEKRTEAKLAGQPRPNVLFEAGLALVD
jgi:predicted nucleotide-binding protein